MSIGNTHTANISLAIRGHKSCIFNERVYSVCSNHLSSNQELTIACTVVRDGLINISYLRFNIAPDLDVSHAAMCTFGSTLLLAIPSPEHPLEFFTFFPETTQLKEIQGPVVASRWGFSIIEVKPGIVLLSGGNYIKTCYLLDFTNKTVSETARLPFLASHMTLVKLSDDLIAAPTFALAEQFPTNKCLFYSVSTEIWYDQTLPIPEHIHYGTAVLSDQLLLLLTPRPQQKGVLEVRGYIYDHKTNAIYMLERPDFPSYCDPVVFIHSRRLYVIGGLQHGKVSTSVYDIDLAVFITGFKDQKLRSSLKEVFKV